MALLNEQEHSLPQLSTIIIIVALIGILIAFETCKEPLDESQLTSKEITLKKRPEYINRTRNTPTHYLIYSNEYLTPFWISGAGLSIVEDHEMHSRRFRRRVNDTLKLLILTSELNSLDNPNQHIDIYGLADSKRTYFNPAIVSSVNNKRTKIFLLFSAALLITGLVMKYKKVFTARTT